jgi:cellulose synthase operon protein C
VSRRLLVALLLLAAACSNAPEGETAYERGVAALQAGKPRTARVEFMNAIKTDPDSPAARVMQARTYLVLGDGVAAAAEIERARQLGVSVERTRHLMAHALLLQGNPRGAIEETADVPPSHTAYAARIRGQAFMGLGEMGAAAAEFARAIEAGPKNGQVWTDVARFRRATGDLAGAIEAADKAVGLNPRDAEALTLRGELTRSQYGLRAAVPWFDRALEIDPGNVTALLERAATLGDLGEMQAMLADTREALELSPGHPFAYYLQAMLAARAGKFELAGSIYRHTKGAFDDKPAGMLLASAIDYRTGQAEQAVDRLKQLVDLQPHNRTARRLLAAGQWKLGDARGTVDTLATIVDRPDADSYSLTLMGEALKKLGDTELAAVYIARAAQPRRQSATALWSNPVSDAELAVIRQNAADNLSYAPAQVTLIGALLSKGLGEEALDRALALQADNPGAPDAHMLVGDARGMQGDFKGAAEAYRKAANIAFTEPVAMRLIEALERSGQAAAATQVLNLYLEQNPRSVPAQRLAAHRMMAAGEWRQAIRFYESLRHRLGDRDALMLNNLAWAYSQLGDYERALPLAEKAWSLDKDNPATADTYGWLLFKSGRDRARGLSLLERASSGAPTDDQIRAHLEEARQG